VADATGAREGTFCQPETGSCTCNADINYATPIAAGSPQNATAPSGVNCYFKYTAPISSGTPVFTLTTTGEVGNADLYIGVVEDTTGGTLGSEICTSAYPGGGWIRCSRSVDRVETIDLDQGGIQPMTAGWFRIVAIYGHPSVGEASNFTLSVAD